MERVLEREEELARVCERRSVLNLAVFGSAADGAFDSGGSDLDFTVEFGAMMPTEHKNAYFGLLSDLEELFGRDVDLVELKNVENPYVRASIEAGRRTVYAGA